MTSYDGPQRLPGFIRVMQAKEAAASVAIEHPAAHDCVACRATRGDADALAEILAMLDEAERRAPDPEDLYRATTIRKPPPKS